MSSAIPASVCISAYTTTKPVRSQELLHLSETLNEESTAKAIENMIVDAMLAAEPHLKIASNIGDPKKYLGLTDDIRTEIQRSQAPVSAYVLRIFSLPRRKCIALGTPGGTENSRAHTEPGSLSLRRLQGLRLGTP